MITLWFTVDISMLLSLNAWTWPFKSSFLTISCMCAKHCHLLYFFIPSGSCPRPSSARRFPSDFHVFFILCPWPLLPCVEQILIQISVCAQFSENFYLLHNRSTLHTCAIDWIHKGVLSTLINTSNLVRVLQMASIEEVINTRSRKGKWRGTAPLCLQCYRSDCGAD